VVKGLSVISQKIYVMFEKYIQNFIQGTLMDMTAWETKQMISEIKITVR
jgi:hypothetical protein